MMLIMLIRKFIVFIIVVTSFLSLVNCKGMLKRNSWFIQFAYYTPCPEKNGPPTHVKITLWIENDSHYFSLCDEKPSICNVYVKFHDN